MRCLVDRSPYWLHQLAQTSPNTIRCSHPIYGSNEQTYDDRSPVANFNCRARHSVHPHLDGRVSLVFIAAIGYVVSALSAIA